MANCLRVMSRWGWGLSRKEILEVIGQYVKKNNIITPFKDGIPGEDWFLGFKKRHRLSIKKPQSLEFARKKATDPFLIYEYFDLLLKVLEDLDLNDKPHQIYNLDETSFCLDPSKTKIVGEINQPASRVVSGPGRENTTVLFGANAAGDKLPPLIIFKGKNVWDTWMASDSDTFPDTTYAASDNGWMQGDIFFNYMKNSFIKNCVADRPILLIFDGHTTHLGQETIDLALENQITILKLPPHTSHLLQPLDLAVYKSVKVRWDIKLSAFQRKHIGLKIPKKEFATLVGTVWKEITPEIIKKGFKKGGVVPFNRNVVPEEKFDPEALKRYKAMCKDKNSPPTPTEESDLPVSSVVQTAEDLAVPGTSKNPSTVSSLEDSIPDGQEDTTSFEELLLDTIKQTPIMMKKKKKRVAKGAEVITQKESEERVKEIEANLQKKKTDKKLPKDKKMKVVKGKKKNVSKRLLSDDSDSEEEKIVGLSDSEDDVMTLEQLKMHVDSTVEDAMEEDFEFQCSNYKVGDWVLAKFSSKTTIKHYVAQIIEFIDEEPMIKCARKKSAHIFVWPEQEDKTLINTEDILVRLPVPVIGRREEIIFKVSFATYNIQ